MALNTTISPVNGAHDRDTLLKNVPRSTNASCAMEQDTSNRIATSPVSIAKMDKSVEYQMTTLALPTHHVQPMSGPLDGRKDVDKGVMSQETSQYHVTQRGDSPLFLYDSMQLGTA